MYSKFLGYCKDCISYLSGYCTQPRELISASPACNCTRKRYYKMLPVPPDFDMENIEFEWCGEKYLVDNVFFTNANLINLSDESRACRLMDVVLVYNMYRCSKGDHPLFKELMNEYETSEIKIVTNDNLVSKKLNVNKISTLDDVKAILDVLNIEFNNIEKDGPIITKIGHLLDDKENGGK